MCLSLRFVFSAVSLAPNLLCFFTGSTSLGDDWIFFKYFGLLIPVCCDRSPTAHVPVSIVSKIGAVLIMSTPSLLRLEVIDCWHNVMPRRLEPFMLGVISFLLDPVRLVLTLPWSKIKHEVKQQSFLTVSGWHAAESLWSNTQCSDKVRNLPHQKMFSQTAEVANNYFLTCLTSSVTLLSSSSALLKH